MRDAGRVRDACAALALKLGHQDVALKLYWTPAPLLMRYGSRLPRRKVDARQVQADRLLAGLASHRPSRAVRDALAVESNR